MTARCSNAVVYSAESYASERNGAQKPLLHSAACPLAMHSAQCNGTCAGLRFGGGGGAGTCLSGGGEGGRGSRGAPPPPVGTYSFHQEQKFIGQFIGPLSAWKCQCRVPSPTTHSTNTTKRDIHHFLPHHSDPQGQSESASPKVEPVSVVGAPLEPDDDEESDSLPELVTSDKLSGCPSAVP